MDLLVAVGQKPSCNSGVMVPPPALPGAKGDVSVGKGDETEEQVPCESLSLTL